MRSGELQTGKLTRQTVGERNKRCPLGSAGVVRYFFRVFRVEAYGISVTRIFFFFVLILSLIQNNRRFHVFDRRARSDFRESARSRIDPIGPETVSKPKRASASV